MPQTLNTHHSGNFNAYFPSQNQQNVKFLPEICDFLGPAYYRDFKTCSIGIWIASNPKYAPLKPFQCISPRQNQQNVKFWLFP